MSYSIRALALSAIALPVLAFAAPASAQGIEGTWEASIPLRLSNENGEMKASDFNRVMIALELKGDSVFGTWTASPTETTPAPKPRVMKGTLKDGVAVLVGEPNDARVNMNGEERVIKMTITYTLKVTGDEMAGTMTTTSPDVDMEMRERTFKATRKKA